MHVPSKFPTAVHVIGYSFVFIQSSPPLGDVSVTTGGEGEGRLW